MQRGAQPEQLRVQQRRTSRSVHLCWPVVPAAVWIETVCSTQHRHTPSNSASQTAAGGRPAGGRPPTDASDGATAGGCRHAAAMLLHIQASICCHSASQSATLRLAGAEPKTCVPKPAPPALERAAKDADVSTGTITNPKKSVQRGVCGHTDTKPGQRRLGPLLKANPPPAGPHFSAP